MSKGEKKLLEAIFAENLFDQRVKRLGKLLSLKSPAKLTTDACLLVLEAARYAESIAGDDHLLGPMARRRFRTQKHSSTPRRAK